MPWNWNATLIFYTYSWIHNSIAIKVYKDFPLLYKKIPTGWHWLVYLSFFTYVNLYLNMSCSDEFCSSEIFQGGGVYRPLWPPTPMSIRQPMLGQDRVINSTIFYYLLDSMLNRRWNCTLQWKWWYWGEWTLLPIFSTCAHLIMVNKNQITHGNYNI